MKASRFRPGSKLVLSTACVATMASGPGQTYLVAMFHDPIQESLALSTTEMSGAYMVATACASLGLVRMGRFSDRAGPWKALSWVTVLFGLACFVMASVPWLATLMSPLVALGLGFFLIRFLGQGSMTLTSGHLLAAWFDRTLGRVESVRSLAVSVMIAISPLLVERMIHAWDWQVTYRILGVLVWGSVLPLSMLGMRMRITREPDVSDVGASSNADVLPMSERSASTEPVGLDLRQALRTIRYWVVGAAVVANALVTTALTFHLQPMLRAAGMSTENASARITTMAVSAGIFMLVAGWLTDKVRPEWIFGAGLLALAGSSLAWLMPLGPLRITVAYVVLGMAQPLIAVPIGPTLKRAFGDAHHAAIRGSLATAAVLGTSVGPLWVGSLYDRSGSYASAYLTMATFALAITAFAGVALFRAPPRPASGMSN